jgi:uncharacterized protein YodC (DUF2158 family)
VKLVDFIEASYRTKPQGVPELPDTLAMRRVRKWVGGIFCHVRLDMPTEFEKGEKVILNSGGRVMTVRSKHLEDSIDGPEYSCEWFAGQECRRQTFLVTSLQKYVPTKKAVASVRYMN